MTHGSISSLFALPAELWPLNLDKIYFSKIIVITQYEINENCT